MLRLVTALALVRYAAAETTPPGTGYSDADSCPPPERTPFGAVLTQMIPSLEERRARPCRDHGGGARNSGRDGNCFPRDVGQERVERRGGLPDARVGITKTRAARKTSKEAPLARRLGQGKEVLFVIT